MANKVLGSLLLNLRANISGFQSDMQKAATILKGEVATMGKHAAALQLPIAAIGGFAMNAASEYKAAMNIIRLNTGATGKDLDQFGETLKGLYSGSHDSLKDIATAMSEVSRRTGATGEPLKELTAAMVDFADVTKTDVATTVRNTTTLFGDWGISTGKMIDAMNTLWQVGQMTGMGLGRLAELMKYYGVPMRMLGLTFEQTALMFGKFEREGVNVEMVISSMSRALGNFNKIGIKPVEGLISLIKQIKEAKTLAESTKIAASFVGQRPGQAENFAGAVLEGRLDSAKMEADFKKMHDNFQQADIDTMTFGDRMKELSSTVETALIPLGQELNQRFKKDFIPIMKEAAELVARLGGAFMSLPEWAKNSMLLMAGITAALAGGAPLLGMWISSVLKLSVALKALGVILMGHPIFALGVVTATAVTYAVTTSINFLNDLKKTAEASDNAMGEAESRMKNVMRLESYLKGMGATLPPPPSDASLESFNKYEGQLRKIYENFRAFVGPIQDATAAQKGNTSITLEQAEAMKKLKDAIDKGVTSFLDNNRITEEEIGTMKALESQGIPVWKMYEMVSSKMDKITESSDPLIKKLLEIKDAMGTGKEAYELSVKQAEAEREISKIFLSRGQAKFNAPNPSNIYNPKLEEWQAEMLSKAKALLDNVTNFKNYRKELILTIDTINQLAGGGEDLRLIYKQFGGVLENQPEMLSKATTKILEQGKMLSIINDGWKNIGKTIETSISGAFSDLLSNAKTLKDALAGIWDSIKRSFTDMLGAMVSAFMMRFLSPILTQIRGQATGTGSLAGGMASMIPSMVMGGGATGGYPMGAYGGGIIGSGAMGGPSLVGGVYSAGGAGSGGRMGAFGSALGPYGMFGGTMGAALGGNYLGGVMGGGTAGSILGMAAGGLGGAFAGAGIAGAMGIGTASMAGLLAAMGGTVVLAPIVAAIAAAALINHLYKSPADRASQETSRDFGGIKMTTQTFEQFAASLGLGKKQYEGIRKDLLSSPKFLTEVAYPLAKQQGKMDEFLKSLEAVSTAWGTFNFRTAFEAWVKTGNSDALNKAFTSAFATSQALQQNLPDWRNVLAASGAAGSSTSSVRLPINRPITTTPPAPVTPAPITTPTALPPPQQIIFSPTINAVDGADVTRVMRDKLFPAFLDMLKNNTGESRRKLTQVLV